MSNWETSGNFAGGAGVAALAAVNAAIQRNAANLTTARSAATPIL